MLLVNVLLYVSIVFNDALKQLLPNPTGYIITPHPQEPPRAEGKRIEDGGEQKVMRWM
jgi:hypothetical protein